jgi:hypothetical protein
MKGSEHNDLQFRRNYKTNLSGGKVELATEWTFISSGF